MSGAQQTRMTTLEATRVALKAKLADKGRLRPHEMVRKKMPDGTGSLQDLPRRAHGAAAEHEEFLERPQVAVLVRRCVTVEEQNTAVGYHGKN